jgi:hypothetical protein
VSHINDRQPQAILAARSAYFARMFGSGLAESFQSEIAITQVSPRTPHRTIWQSRVTEDGKFTYLAV